MNGETEQERAETRKRYQAQASGTFGEIASDLSAAQDLLFELEEGGTQEHVLKRGSQLRMAADLVASAAARINREAGRVDVLADFAGD